MTNQGQIQERQRKLYTAVFHPRELAGRISMAISLCSLLGIAMLACVMLMQSYISSGNMLERDNRALAETLVVAGFNHPSLLMHDSEMSQHLSILGASDTVSNAQVIDSNGRVVAQYNSENEPVVPWLFRSLFHPYVLKLPVTVDGEVYGSLDIKFNQASRAMDFQRQIFETLIIALMCIIIAIIISLRISRRLIRPISALEQTIGKIVESEDYHYRVDIEQADVLFNLTRDFNTMLEVLEARDTEMDELITNLKKAREEADMANQSKSRFLANMSHEIRTPLNGVLGMAQALRTVCTTPKQLMMIDLIKQSGAILLTIVNDVLDMAKVESGKTELSYKRDNIHILMKRLTSLWTPKASEHNSALVLKIYDSVPELMVFDASRVEQCINNLVSNAIKFTHDGTVTLTVYFQPDKVPGGGRMVVKVADTGQGIPPDKVATIFDSFAQVDNSLTTTVGGTGLGLAIVRELAKLMGGDVVVSSQPGIGSEFEFSFLATYPDPEDMDLAPSNGPETKKAAAHTPENASDTQGSSDQVIADYQIYDHDDEDAAIYALLEDALAS